MLTIAQAHFFCNNFVSDILSFVQEFIDYG